MERFPQPQQPQHARIPEIDIDEPSQSEPENRMCQRVHSSPQPNSKILAVRNIIKGPTSTETFWRRNKSCASLSALSSTDAQWPCWTWTHPESSSRTLPEQEDLHRLEQNQQIKADRSILDIEKVVREFFLVVLYCGAIAAVDLGPASRTGFDSPALTVIGNLFQAFLFLVRNERPGPDKMHITTDNVGELR